MLKKEAVEGLAEFADEIRLTDDIKQAKDHMDELGHKNIKNDKRDPFIIAFDRYLFAMRKQEGDLMGGGLDHDELVKRAKTNPTLAEEMKSTQEAYLDLMSQYYEYDRAIRNEFEYLLNEYQNPDQKGKAILDLKKAVNSGYVYIIKYVLYDGTTKYINLNKNNVERIIESFNSVWSNTQGNIFSGLSIHYLVNPGYINAIYKIPKVNKKGNPIKEHRGKMFARRNTSKHNLIRYQIISSPEDVSICREHCLLYALRMAGISESKMDKVRPLITSGHYPMSKLSAIAKLINRHIHLRSYLMRQKTHNKYSKGEKALCIHSTHYNRKEGNKTIYLALYQNHYMVCDQVIYGNKKTNSTIPSIAMIKDLDDKGFFIEDRCFDSIPQVFNKSDGTSICESEQSGDINLPSDKKKIDPKVTAIIFADTEATVNNKMFNKDKECITEKAHKAFRHGFVFLDGDEVHLSNTLDEHFKFMVKLCEVSKYKNAVVYYHNLKYDFALMKSEPNLNILGMTVKDGALYSVKLSYFGFKITLRDSYKLISYKLSEFATSFKLDTMKQEYIIYELYNEKNVMSEEVRVDYLKAAKLRNTKIHAYNIDGSKYVKITKDEAYEKVNDYILIDERIIVPKSCIELFNGLIPGVQLIKPPRVGFRGISVPGTYKHKVHCDHYLKYDCIVLRDGMKAFNNFMSESLGINIFNYLTISSLAHDYAINKGCYKGVYGICGNTRNFVTQCMAGGRVCTRYNKRHEASGRIEDYDGVSLYPSAIHRLAKEIGFPCGRFREIKDQQRFEKIRNDKHTIYYFVEIEALQNTKRQQIAFPRIKKDDKIIYTNEIKGKRLYLGKIAFEDLVNFCELREYKFIKGIYWSESDSEPGRNRGLGNVVEQLFNMRLEAKAERNKVGDTCMKLALNSLYGKNMLGRKKDKIICKTKDDHLSYLKKNSSDIKDFSIIGRTVVYREEVESLHECNNIHIACMILDMSKRIMNEVLSIADDNNIVVLYTDTDSMHIINTNGELERLKQEYQKKYSRELDGSKLGQFHSDFLFPGCTDVYAVKSLIVDKKMYCDVLRGMKDGNEVFTVHYRFKGINDASMKEQEKKFGSIVNVYAALMNGTKIPFNLCYGDAPSFDLSGLTPFSRDTYIRNVELDTSVDIEYHKA